MATNIQASQTSGLIISPDQSGVLTLQSGSNTATMPAATGTVMVSGNMPAFSAYSNTTQTIATSTWTKVQYNNKEFDTANCYDATTNYRFTPTIAGYYFIHAFFEWASASANATSADIYKNGSLWRRGQFYASTSGNNKVECTDLMYMNGSTDYVEIYCYQTSGSNLQNQNGNGQQYSVFQGYLVRTA